MNLPKVKIYDKVNLIETVAIITRDYWDKFHCQFGCLRNLRDINEPLGCLMESKTNYSLLDQDLITLADFIFYFARNH